MAADTDSLGQQEPRVNRRDFVLFFCIGLFMVSLIVAAVTAVKIQTVSLFGFVLLVPAGSLAFSLTYLATDVISEVWGRAYAFMVLLAGLALRFVMLALFLFAMHGEDVIGFLGVADTWTPQRQEAFIGLLGSSNRINLAGIVAFAVSTLADIWIFHRMRVRDAGKNRLWLRNNLSTILSQVLNSIIFITVAFGWTMSWAAIGSLILGQVVIKLGVAVIDTPMVYILRNLALGRPVFDFRG